MLCYINLDSLYFVSISYCLLTKVLLRHERPKGYKILFQQRSLRHTCGVVVIVRRVYKHIAHPHQVLYTQASTQFILDISAESVIIIAFAQNGGSS